MSGRAGVEYADPAAHGQAIQYDPGATLAEAPAADPATAAATDPSRPAPERRPRRHDGHHLSAAHGLSVAGDPTRVWLGPDLPSAVSSSFRSGSAKACSRSSSSVRCTTYDRRRGIQWTWGALDSVIAKAPKGGSLRDRTQPTERNRARNGTS